MSKTTTIQWCDSAVNPVMGCTGCELWNDARKSCYAGQLHQLRSSHPGFSPDFDTPKLFPGRMKEAAGWSDLTGTERPEKPWLNGLPRLIFVSDMGDALSEHGAIDNNNKPIADGGVPFEFLKAEIIDAAISPKGQRHCWLWLTKRPQRLGQFCDWLSDNFDLTLPANIWIGASVTTKAALARVAELAKIGPPSSVRFVSAEPLWEEVSLTNYLKQISWVIAGGESAQGESPKEFQVAWAIRLMRECAQAGVPFFLKQLGSHVTVNGRPIRFRDSHGGDWQEWPQILRVRQMPRVK